MRQKNTLFGIFERLLAFKWLLPVILLAICCLVFWQVHRLVTEPFVPSTHQHRARDIETDTASKIIARKNDDGAAYDVIPQKNLFRPNRAPYYTPTPLNIPTPTPTERPVSVKNYVLSGIVIAGSFKKAFIEDKANKGATESYGVEDKLGDFTVSDILIDRVILKRGNDVAQLMMDRFQRKYGLPTRRERIESLLEKYITGETEPEQVVFEIFMGEETPFHNVNISGKEMTIPMTKKREYYKPEIVEYHGKKYQRISGKLVSYRESNQGVIRTLPDGTKIMNISGKTIEVPPPPSQPAYLLSGEQRGGSSPYFRAIGVISGQGR